MASVQVMKRLQNRAEEADGIIAQMKEELAELRKAAAMKVCQEEEKILIAENAALRVEVEQLKNKLVQAEIRNGLKQIPLPDRSSTKTTTSAASAPTPQPPAAPAAEQQKQQQQKGEKGKAKKEKKEKPKQPQAPAAGEPPVDASRLDMRIGRIVNAKKHPDADTLYVEEVDLAEGTNRTIVSGLVKHVPLEKMQQRLAIFMLNLKPAKMRGIMSQGMIMCANTPDGCEIIDPPEGVVPGDRVTIDGYEGTPDAMLNPKKKIWEQIQPDLHTNENCEATYKGALWRVPGKGLCKVQTMKNSGIK